MDAKGLGSSQKLLKVSKADHYPFPKLLALTIAFLGIQFTWSVQVGYVTKTLQERLGLPKRFVSYAWLAGPVAGMIVQPTVGLLSDRFDTRFGRRRPFILGGSLVAAAALLLFAWAQHLWVGILAFWILDFAINAAQGPLRALLTDVIPDDQQGQGNALFSLMTGIGNASGNFLGSLPLGKLTGDKLEDVQVLYAMAVVILLVTVLVCVIVTKEEGSRASGQGYERIEEANESRKGVAGLRDDNDADESSDEPLSLWEACVNAPRPFWRLFSVQNFMWFAWFSVLIFTTSWVGTAVFEGDPSKPKGDERRELYDKGTRFANLGLALQAVTSIVYSMLLPYLLHRLGTIPVYFFANLVHGLALVSMPFMIGQSGKFFALCAIAILGIPWATTMTVPWALAGSSISKSAPKSAGLYLTIFNLSQCFPEIAVSLFAEEIIRWTGREVTVIAIGGFVGLIGAALTLVLNVNKKAGGETLVV